MFWTAFLLGLAGSLHCVAMCGPLMLAIPFADRKQIIRESLLYQGGRMTTYGMLGLFFGLLGKGIAVAGFQQALSILAGAVLIVAAFFAAEWERAALAVPGMRQLTQWVRQQLGQLIRQNTAGAAWGMGMLNGLLPCGLVYAAIAGAISTTSGWEGSLFMLLFGLGTLPLLFLLMSGGQRFSPVWRKKLRLIQPALLLLAGALLLSRGLHLDLSLFQSAVPKALPECH